MGAPASRPRPWSHDDPAPLRPAGAEDPGLTVGALATLTGASTPHRAHCPNPRNSRRGTLASAVPAMRNGVIDLMNDRLAGLVPCPRSVRALEGTIALTRRPKVRS